MPFICITTGTSTSFPGSLLFTPQEAREGRPWLGLVTCRPREKLDPGRGPSPASLCQDLLSTPKRGFRFTARNPPETHSTGYVFQPSSLPFASYCNINLKAKRVRCIEALYWEGCSCCLTKRIRKDNDFPSSSFAIG